MCDGRSVSLAPMKKNALFAIVVGAICGLESNLFGQNTLSPDSLDPIIVHEKRLDFMLTESSRNIEVISKKEIRLLPVQSTQELLSLLSGVDMRSRGPWGGQADMSILGSTFEQVLILIDGIPMRDPQTNHHQMNLPIQLDQIEQIEVLKGSAARIYGPNAMAGAINIVTKKNSSNDVNITGFAGSPITTSEDKSTPYGLLGARASIGIQQHHIDISALRTDGYRYNSSNNQYQVGYRGHFKVAKGEMNLLAGHLDNGFGARDFYASPYDYNAYERVQTTFAGASYVRQLGNWKIRPMLYWRYNFDDYIFIRQKPEVYRNNHFSTSAGSEFHASKSNRLGTFGLGVEARTEIIRSNNLGAHQRNFFNAYAEQRFLFQSGANLTLGTLAIYSPTYLFKMLPGVEFSIPVLRNWRAFGNLGLGNRYPTFTDLYYQDSANQGNDQLQPEQAIFAELGTKFSRHKMEGSASVFRRTTWDFIDYTRPDAASKWTPENFQEVVADGVDVRLSYRNLSERALEKGGVQWIAARLGYTYLDISLNNPQDFSKYGLNHYRHQLTGQVVIATGQRILHTLSARYFERFEGNSASIFDYRMTYKTNALDLTLDVLNILDRQYVASGFVPAPGRWFRLGVGYAFKRN